MPPFYFDVIHDNQRSAQVSSELPDRDSAWRQAVRAAGDMIRDLGPRFRPGTEWRMDVADGAGQRIFSLRLIGEWHD
jgi:hypothetical protein